MFDPQSTAAEWYLGGLSAEELPRFACEALERGHDGSKLRQLAGLVKHTKGDLEGIVDGALREVGVVAPLSKDEAASFLVSKVKAAAKSNAGPVEISAQNLVGELLAALPELEPLYVERVKSLCGLPGNYMAIAMVWRPTLKKHIAEGGDTDFVLRSSSLMERLCRSDDTEAINVLWIEILEWLVHSPDELKFLWPVLGPATKAKVRCVAFRRKETENLPDYNFPKARWWSVFRRKSV